MSDYLECCQTRHSVNPFKRQHAFYYWSWLLQTQVKISCWLSITPQEVGWNNLWARKSVRRHATQLLTSEMSMWQDCLKVASLREGFFSIVDWHLREIRLVITMKILYLSLFAWAAATILHHSKIFVLREVFACTGSQHVSLLGA
jgi:hypothetical protein